MIRPTNRLYARFYDRATLDPLPDPARIGGMVSVEGFDASYPGGFGSATLSTVCDPTMPMPFSEGDFVRVYNGARIVYEGFVASVGFWFSRESKGVRLRCTGFWGWVMARRTKEKRWADSRMTADVWVEPPTAYSGNDQTLKQIVTVDRIDGRLRFTPKNEAFTNQWYGRLLYTMPTGETIKRIKGSRDMQEAAQAWELTAFNITTAANEFNITASGTGTYDVTLATPSQSLMIFFRAAANQTPPSDGTIYGQVDDAISGATPFMVYSETGNINAYEVFRDVRAMVSELSADESQISSALTVSVEPFITQGREALAGILARIAGYGTTAYGPIGYGVRDSSQSNDGKPILFAEAYPDISTGYEWEININDRQIDDTAEIVEDASGIANWIAVTYSDDIGNTQTVTPDDDSTLKDTTSIVKYGERHLPYPLNLGSVGRTAAIAYGRKYLSKSKDKQVYVSGSITYKGWVIGKGGVRIPAANAVADVTMGVRAKVVNWVADTLDIAGAGLTAVVSSAQYSDRDGGSIRITFGHPDDLAAYLARIPTIKATPNAAGANKDAPFGSGSVTA